MRAGLALCEAIELQTAGVPVQEAARARSTLYGQADTMPRSYAVASRVPLLGKRIAQARSIGTVHLKEAYFDRIMEQQVSFNRALAGSIDALSQEIADTIAVLDEKARRP